MPPKLSRPRLIFDLNLILDEPGRLSYDIGAVEADILRSTMGATQVAPVVLEASTIPVPACALARELESLKRLEVPRGFGLITEM